VADHQRRLYLLLRIGADAQHLQGLLRDKDKIRKLDLGPQQSHVYTGDATGRFKVAEPFKFQG
jgi:hypothetical protein